MILFFHNPLHNTIIHNIIISTGIVSDLTNVVVKAGGNVGESRALTLGDHFSLMMLVSIPESKDSEVKESFSGIKDLHTNTFDTSDPKATIIASPEIGCKFDILCAKIISLKYVVDLHSSLFLLYPYKHHFPLFILTTLFCFLNM